MIWAPNAVSAQWVALGLMEVDDKSQELDTKGVTIDEMGVLVKALPLKCGGMGTFCKSTCIVSFAKI